MYLSVITVNNWYEGTEEMYIPKVIGFARKGFASLKRLNRLLPVGHRYHGYEEVL